MSEIKVNIDELEVKSKSFKKAYYGFEELLNSTGSIECVGKGRTQDALEEINVSCDRLNEALKELYVNVYTFIECTKDGIVETNEYTKKLSEGIQ